MDAQPLLEQLMDSRDDADIMAAARALAPRSGLAPQAARLLEELLNTGTAARAAAAAFVLGEWGPTALATSPGLVTSLRKQTAHHNVTVRHWSVTALMRLGVRAASAVPELAACLRDADDGVRAVAAHALGELGSTASGAIGALVDAAYDANKEVRKAAVATLLRVDADGKQSVPELVKGLSSPSSRVRMQSAEALGRLHVIARGAGRDLAACLHDAQPLVRGKAIEALIRILPAEHLLLAALSVALHDPDDDVRIEAVLGLQTFAQQPVEAAPHLIAALRDREPRVRFHAIEILERFTPDLGPMIPAAGVAIGNCLRDPSELVQTRAVKASGRLAPWTNKTDPRILNALHESDPEVRLAATQALGHMHGDPATVDALRFRLADERADIRVAACRALAQMGENPDAFKGTLVQALGDSDPAIQAEAIAVFEFIGEHALDALEALRGKLADSNESIREAAASAVARIERASRRE